MWHIISNRQLQNIKTQEHSNGLRAGFNLGFQQGKVYQSNCELLEAALAGTSLIERQISQIIRNSEVERDSEG